LAYVPYVSHNRTLFYYLSHDGVLPSALVTRYLAQTPGVQVIDVNLNVPTKMHIPWVNPLPMGRLFNSAEIPVGHNTSFDDFQGMGTLFLSVLNPVSFASTGSATSVSATVYVRAKNVVLGCSTGTVLLTECQDFTTEAGDERVRGPVERMSTALAAAMGAFTRVPGIGVYARASQIALNAVSGISSLIGFSYPTLNATPSRFKNEPFQNAANVIGVDTGKRITLDPKQELTVDPAICGVSEDELMISAFCKRPGLLDRVEWNVTDAPNSGSIWAFAVSPGSSVTYPVTTPDGFFRFYQPTPLAFASTMFTHWHGSITVCVDIVCSKFHRGKLGVFYEPDLCQYSLLDGSTSFNKQMMTVIDIQETQRVEITIEWASNRAWLRNFVNNNNYLAYNLSPEGSVAEGSDVILAPVTKSLMANGFLYLTPVTALQSPNGGHIDINIWVYSHDMKFMGPTHDLPETFEVPLEEELKTECDDLYYAPSTKITINPSSTKDDHLFDLYFGEAVGSFRALIKRFYVQFTTSPDFTVASAWKWFIPNLRPVEGTTISGVFPMMQRCFLGFRGGLRKRLTLDRWDLQIGTIKVMLSGQNPPSDAQAFAQSSDSYCNPAGTVTFVPQTNTGVEFEVPFYSNTLFRFCADPNFSSDQTDTIFWNQHEIIGFSAISGGPTIYVEESAAGEDFSFLRFVACPMISYHFE